MRATNAPLALQIAVTCQKVYNQFSPNPKPCHCAALKTVSPSQHVVVVDLLRHVPYFQGQTDEVLDALAAAAIRSTFRAGATIFVQGEPSQGLFVIESGEVKIGRLSKEGREHILHVLRLGETFNDVAALDGGVNPATATARTEAVVWCICRPHLKHIAAQHPALAWALIESIARRARYLVGLVEDLGMRNVRGRLANLLLTEARAHEAGAVPRMLTQEEIASRLGTVREVVGRVLRGLATEGIIAFDRHRIVILDADRLAEAAEA